MNMDAKNRRRFKRAPIKARIGFFLGGNYTLGEAVVIGEGGMLLHTRRPSCVDAPIEIHFYLNDRFITAKAKILYVNKEETFSQIGVEFYEIAESDRTAIHDYVNTNTL